MTTRDAFLALNMIQGIGPTKVRRLLDRFHTPERILSASIPELLDTPGVGAETATAIHRWNTTVDIEKEKRRIERHGARTLIGSDPEYPSLLKQIYDPPIILYIRGNLLAQDHHGVAIVGSRSVSSYGRANTQRFAGSLARSGLTIVSGGARGVDTLAHRSALETNGRTIAVLGNGMGSTYPVENERLFETIAQNGAVLSEFPFDRRGDRQTFPIRNRIVAGMTRSTLVVAAKAESGALITANFAAEYGRSVFAIPGPLNDHSTAGCHQLIKDGAGLCDSPNDILEEWGTLFPPQPDTRVQPLPPSQRPHLSDLEATVLNAVDIQETPIDAINAKTQLPSGKISSVLLQLELKGLIRAHPGKRFTRSDNDTHWQK